MFREVLIWFSLLLEAVALYEIYVNDNAGQGLLVILLAIANYLAVVAWTCAMLIKKRDV